MKAGAAARTPPVASDCVCLEWKSLINHPQIGGKHHHLASTLYEEQQGNKGYFISSSFMFFLGDTLMILLLGLFGLCLNHAMRT